MRRRAFLAVAGLWRALRRLVRPRSLRYQLLARSLWVLSGLLLFIGLFQYAFMTHFLYHNTAADLRSEVRAIPLRVWMAAPRFDGWSRPDRPQPFSIGLPGTRLAWVDASGQLQALFPAASGTDAVRLPATVYRDALAHGTGEGDYRVVRDAQGRPQLVVLVPVGPPGQPVGLVQVSADAEPLRRVLMRQLIIFVCLAASAMVAGCLTFIPTIRRTLDPLSQMVDTVQRIDAGKLDERIDIQGAQTEVVQLAASFNAMLERLHRAFAAERAARERMRQFVADASHELRTPITAIRGFIEVLGRGAARDPAQRERALASMQREAERLSKLVQDLLTLARMDEAPELHLRRQALDGLLTELEPQLRVLAGARALEWDVDEGGVAWVDRDRIQQVVLNLFQNAVQHTDPETGRIRVSLRREAGGVRMAVRDNGEGIDEAHRDRLFERFYRVDPARSRSHGGAGLGLAISKAIVEAHGGTIACESEPGRGAEFIVTLPAAPDPPRPPA
jgi:two-component system OmpR family sensor kinase